MTHTNSFIINIYIADMHRLTYRILDISNEFHDKNVPIHERFCVSIPTYDLDWFDISYLNVPLNEYEGTFFL